MKNSLFLLLFFGILSCKKDDKYIEIPHNYIPKYTKGDTLVFSSSDSVYVEYICNSSYMYYLKRKLNDNYDTYDQIYRGEFVQDNNSTYRIIIDIRPTQVNFGLFFNWVLKLNYQEGFSMINEDLIFSESIYDNIYDDVIDIGTYPESSRHAKYDLFKGIVTYQDTLGKEWKLKEIRH